MLVLNVPLDEVSEGHTVSVPLSPHAHILLQTQVLDLIEGFAIVRDVTTPGKKSSLNIAMVSCALDERFSNDSRIFDESRHLEKQTRYNAGKE